MILQPNTSSDYSQNKRNEEIGALTGIRGIACFIVIFFHTSVGAHRPKMYNLARIAVSLFFALSGFIMNLSNSKYKINKCKKCRNFYYAKRVAKIMPAYFFSLLISVYNIRCILNSSCNSIEIFINEESLNPNDLVTNPWTKYLHSTSIILTPFFLQALLPICNIWNCPSWSLSIEMICYFIFSFLPIFSDDEHTKKKRLSLTIFCTIMTNISWIVRVFFLSELYKYDALYYIIDNATYFNIFFRMWEFLSAALLTSYYSSWIRVKKTYGLCFNIFMQSIPYIFFLVWFLLPSNSKILSFGPFFILEYFTIVSLTYHPSYLLNKILTSPLAIFLGKISYSTYITHIVFLTILWDLNLDIKIYQTVCFILVYFIGWLTQKYIEEPYYTKIRNYFQSTSKILCICDVIET